MRLQRSIQACLCLLLAWACATSTSQRHEFRAAKMGTEFRLVLYAPSAEVARRAAARAWARVDELEACMSDYRANSELSQLAARQLESGSEAWLPVSEDLYRVLAAAKETSTVTGGAFDVTVGPYVRLWRRARRQERLPAPQALAEAAKAVGHELLELDRARGSLRLGAPDMRLDLGGIGKGYALDEVLEVLQAEGITAALIDGGGDVRVGAAPPGRKAWRVRVEAPGEDLVLDLVDSAVATSGDAYRFVELDGVRYSHLVDPRTGGALTHQLTVSVVAPDATRADAAASAVSVLGTTLGLEWLAGVPELEARLVWLENDGLGTCQTSGLERMMAQDLDPSEPFPVEEKDP